jgi:hypothetical protein
MPISGFWLDEVGNQAPEKMLDGRCLLRDKKAQHLVGCALNENWGSL